MRAADPVVNLPRYMFSWSLNLSMFGASPYVFSDNYYHHQPQMQPSFGYQPLQPPMQVGGGPFTFSVGHGCMLQQQHPGGI